MKKILKALLLIITMIGIVACEKKESEEKKMEDTFKQDLTIIEEKDGEVTKGTLEGYTFTESETPTDRVKIQMEDGSIILMVLSNKDTPITIENFKKLVNKKFYDGIIFHRVIKDFMIQGGDPTGTGYEGSGEEIKGEFKSNGVTNNLSHTRGVVSMARANNPNSASSQFFICHQDSTFLDGNYASFGKVFAGMDAVDKIAEVETNKSNDKPLKDQVIKSIRFIDIEKN